MTACLAESAFIECRYSKLPQHRLGKPEVRFAYRTRAIKNPS
jgi:hypothetical protein